MENNLEEKFQKLHSEKPEIYAAFKKIIKQLQDRGFTHYSADGVFHIVRFTTGASMGADFKVNNNYVSRYARMYADEHPEHKDFFRFKELKRA